MIAKDDTQLLKGIAIIMVIAEHLGQVLHIGILNPLGPVGVCLFLLISGYGLSYSYENNGRNGYFRKRVLKVYIPYLISVICFSVWSFCIGNTLNVRSVFSYAVLINLPQGSFWYLRLLFYWYIIFFFLTFSFDNERILVGVLCVATGVVTIWSGFNRLYVWQFASFPAGIILCRHKKIMCVVPKIRGTRGVLVIALLIMVILKKTKYVETNELGVADTVLQIGITWSLSLLILSAIEYLKKTKKAKGIVLAIGGISYELYLAHVLQFDWLKQQATIKKFMVYGIVFLLNTLVIYLINSFIQQVEKSVMRGKT